MRSLHLFCVGLLLLALLQLPDKSLSFQGVTSVPQHPRRITLSSTRLSAASNDNTNPRRFILTTAAATLLLLLPVQTATAGIDPSALRNLPVEGDAAGAAQRLRQLEQQQTATPQNVEFIELPSGVSYGDFRLGRGDAVVQPGSRVAVELTIRCRSLATRDEPGGRKYFSTAQDTDFNELAFTVLGGGGGDDNSNESVLIFPELQQALLGMRRNGIRRVVVPSTVAYRARNNGQLPLPTTKDGQRYFEQIFKSDASLLIEVLVTRIK